MKLILVFIVLVATICVDSEKVLSQTRHNIDRREINLLKRLFKRQAYNDPNCNPRACAVPNCGKDYVATTLQGECCERCVPWEYARSLGIQYPQGPQAVQDHRGQQPYYDPHSQQNRVDVYIYGPDEGARVSSGQSIYFDCEVIAPYNQQVQPRWTRAGNQPLPQKVQSTALSGNRKLARLTIPDATHGDAGRYECSAGTGNPKEQASIDLQVTEGGHYPRPQPQPQPQPQYPNYDPYNQYPHNQPGYYPPQPQPYPQPHTPPPRPQPQPQPQPNADEEGEDEGVEEDEEPADETPAAKKTTTAAPAGQQDGGADEGEYQEDYTEQDK